METGSECNCLVIRQAARQITQLYDAELASTGLRATQFAMLQRLAKLGPSTVKALADALVMDRSTLGHNLRPLQRAKLVAIAVDSDDRRIRRLQLTPLGTKTLTAARAAWARAQRKFHDRVGDTEAAALRTRLRKLIATMRE